MAVSLYDFSIPMLKRGLANMSAMLDKAAAFATAKKFDSLVLAQSRLYPDMYPLVRQADCVRYGQRSRWPARRRGGSEA